MKLKNILHILLGLLLLSSCTDILQVDSNSLVFEDEYGLSDTGDTLYSVVGVLSQLQKLSESYVLMGELRGDLLDLSEWADKDLKAINQFAATDDNPYLASKKDYYAVINNCNYLIENCDTALENRSHKVFETTYAAAKSIRAWTYIQLLMSYGSAKYLESPVLSMEDINESHEELGIYEIFRLLVDDLQDVKGMSLPNYGTIGISADSKKMFFPINMLLGDLNLWLGNYEDAAIAYHELMVDQELTINGLYSNSINLANNTFYSWNNYYWSGAFQTGSEELISNIVTSTQYGESFFLDSMNLNSIFKPSNTAINNWLAEEYYPTSVWSSDMIKQNTLTNGIGDEQIYDLRLLSSWRYNFSNTYTSKAYVIQKWLPQSNQNDIYTKQVPVYRSTLLYLRYAEAVNRLGKPNLAFAVLKNGLTSSNIKKNDIVPVQEKDTILPQYMNFSSLAFNGNVGIRTRSLGMVDTDSLYIIPTMNSISDSIEYIEDLILNELALETAFEGNRFQDLVRVADRRNNPAYLAELVSSKYTNANEMKQYLMDRKNWFVK